MVYLLQKFKKNYYIQILKHKRFFNLWCHTWLHMMSYFWWCCIMCLQLKLFILTLFVTAKTWLVFAQMYQFSLNMSSPQKFSLMSNYVGTNTVIVKRVDCISNYFTTFCTIKVQKFQTLVACQNRLDKHKSPWSDYQNQIRLLLKKQFDFRSSLIRVFPVCFSDQHFVNILWTSILFQKRIRKVWNFRAFTA